MPIKVMLVDDHQILRAGLKMIFETSEEFTVVAEATDGASGLTKLKNVSPDVIILDIRMQPMDGITMLEHLQADDSQIPVVVLTTFDDQMPIQKAMRLGAKGYLLKDADRATIFQTVKSALQGQVFLEQSIAKKAFSAPAATPAIEPLTAKDQEILTAVAQGLHSKEIASNLGIGERTVKAHLTNVYNKLGVFTRAEAVAFALKHHLIEI